MSVVPSPRHIGLKCQVSPPAFSSSDSDASDIRQPPRYEDAVKQVNWNSPDHGWPQILLTSRRRSNSTLPPACSLLSLHHLYCTSFVHPLALSTARTFHPLRVWSCFSPTNVFWRHDDAAVCQYCRRGNFINGVSITVYFLTTCLGHNTSNQNIAIVKVSWY